MQKEKITSKKRAESEILAAFSEMTSRKLRFLAQSGGSPEAVGEQKDALGIKEVTLFLDAKGLDFYFCLFLVSLRYHYLAQNCLKKGSSKIPSIYDVQCSELCNQFALR